MESKKNTENTAIIELNNAIEEKRSEVPSIEIAKALSNGLSAKISAVHKFHAACAQYIMALHPEKPESDEAERIVDGLQRIGGDYARKLMTLEAIDDDTIEAYALATAVKVLDFADYDYSSILR